MQDNEKKPALRFKGFTDPWEQRKLAELTKTITTGKSVNSDEGEVSDGNIGVLKTSCVSYDRFNPSESKPVVKSEQQLVKCAVEKDSVIVSRMNTPERVGACGYVSTDFPNLFLPDRLWKLKFQDTVDTYFVYMMLVSSAYKEKITSMASGTSGSMYNIPKETFLNLQLVIPAKIDEQKQLGKILKKIDTLITLHQRKYEKLVNIKKSMLDKMFPQNGASVPEIRFKSFTDPWEQRKLGDISEIKTGPFGSTLHADDYVSDGIPIITTEHFKTGSLPIDKCGLPQVSENDFSRLSAYILNAGDIVFSRVGSVDINALITPFQSTWLFSGRVLRVRPQNKNSSQFLHTLLETEDVKNDIRTRAVGQTMPSINTEILKTTPLRLPESTLEQEQLGKYFLNLDTLITLHQRKLEKLQNIKKSCLEKMFV